MSKQEELARLADYLRELEQKQQALEIEQRRQEAELAAANNKLVREATSTIQACANKEFNAALHPFISIFQMPEIQYHGYASMKEQTGISTGNGTFILCISLPAHSPIYVYGAISFLADKFYASLQRYVDNAPRFYVATWEITLNDDDEQKQDWQIDASDNRLIATSIEAAIPLAREAYKTKPQAQQSLPKQSDIQQNNVRVLVRVGQNDHITFGWYNFHAQECYIPDFTEPIEIHEWWHLPTIGTGTPV